MWLQFSGKDVTEWGQKVIILLWMRKGDNKCPYPGCFSKELTPSYWSGVLLFQAITAENNITQNNAADLSTMVCCFQPIFNNVPKWNDKDGSRRMSKAISDQRRTTDPIRTIHRNEPQNLTQAVEWQTLWNGMNSRNHLKRTKGQITQAGFTPCRPCVFNSLLSLLQTFSNSSCRTSSVTSTCITHSCLETISLSTKVEVRT